MEFSAPGTIETPLGNITFNGSSDWLRFTKLSGLDGPEMRTPIDHRSQRDGGIVHRFFHGHQFPVAEGYIKASTVAQRNTYEDTLKGYLASTRRTDGRFRITPTGQSERFLTMRQYTPVVLEPDDGIRHTFQFGLITSREPYWLDLAETDTTILSGASATLTNAGNAPGYPTIQVNGAVGDTTFTLTNETTGLSIDYAGQPAGGTGAGHYVELLMYRQTAYKDGTGANMLPYVDESTSDFWTLEPGANLISLSGDFTSALIKWNNAWI